ncbi:uncharacterized protein [Macrobrachium rosenbergii]|uniref:uncharacterized protein n=1 Tax=Macrobrachium rosenbergii TaxID=79674 RepID=UPI0034D49E93
MGETNGPRQRYLRRVWVAEAEEAENGYLLEDARERYVTTSGSTFTNPRPREKQEEEKMPPASVWGPSSPLSTPPITFWRAHRSRIPGGTTHGFRRSAEFTTPIKVALDPPSWPGWGT